MSAVLQNLCKLFVEPLSGRPTDGQLLERFLAHREEAAFTTLMHRHGRMVFGVCQRLLQNVHDAEDAFQATFLVLACKAATISPRDAVGAWLYGVACRTAKKAKAMTAKRRVKEQQFREKSRVVTNTDDAWDELQPLLDEELSRLPEKYQAAIVLCDLEGKTKKEAAGQLHCPEGTLSSWLVRGRRLLARRLASRGIALSAGLLADLLSRNATSASMPTGLIVSTSQAATRFAAKPAATAGVISAKVSTLTQGVLKAMLLSKLKATIAMLAAVCIIAAGVGLPFYHIRAAVPAEVEGRQPVLNAIAENPATQPDSKDEALQTQIAKVLKAHGGEEKLEKLKTFTYRVKTECTISPGSKDHQLFVQLPDKARLEGNYMERENVKFIIVNNKDQKWRKLNDDEAGKYPGMPEGFLKYVGPRSLLRLKDPEMTVSLLGERMAGDTGSLLGDRPAICIRLSRKDGKKIIPFDEFNHSAVDDIQLYFDKDSCLLLKEEFTYSNLNVEVFYSKYKTIDGIPIAQTRTQRANGDVNYRSEIEFKIEDKLDAKLFEKP